MSAAADDDCVAETATFITADKHVHKYMIQVQHVYLVRSDHSFISIHIHLSSHIRAMATSVLSQTLHSLTHTKIRELEKQRTRHEARKAAILASAAAAPDQHERVARLYRGVTELYPENRTASNGGPPYRGGARGRGGRGGRARGGRAALRGGRGSLTAGVSRDVDNIATWLEQARWDASVTTELLDRYEAMLRRALEVQSRRLGLAGLHTQLVMEWSGGQARSSSSSEEKGAEGEAGSFEVVDRQKERLKALCDQFEAVV